MIALELALVWLVLNTAKASSGLTLNQSTGGLSSPLFLDQPRTPNYIALTGANYISVVITDDLAIKLNGKIEVNRHYPGVTNITDLTAIANSLLLRDGIATPPFDFYFYKISQNYVQPGNTGNFQWTYISDLAVATDYTIKKILYDKAGGAWHWWTNTTYQEDT